MHLIQKYHWYLFNNSTQLNYLNEQITWQIEKISTPLWKLGSLIYKFYHLLVKESSLHQLSREGFFVTLCIGVTINKNTSCYHNFSNEASEASWDVDQTPCCFTNSAIIKALKIAPMLDQLRRRMMGKHKKQ